MLASSSRRAILTLDIGTSSTRALLYDVATGIAVPDIMVARQHQPDDTPDGGSILPPEALVEECVECMEGVVNGAGNWKIVAVAVCTFWHSFVGVDGNGECLTPVVLWSDRRAAPQVDWLREKMDAAAYSQRTGCPLHVSYPVGRLLWLRETYPEVFAACRRFLSPGEYLFLRLFGPEKVTCGISMASGTGLWNAGERQWDRETLSFIGGGIGAGHFSSVSDAPVSGLAASFLNRLPELAEVPWFPAVGDGASSNIGCDAIGVKRIALMIGTSAALRVTIPTLEPPVVPPGLWRYQASEGRYLLGGALSNGGSVWNWLRKTFPFSEIDNDTLEAEIAQLPPDGHGLTVLPFYSGERAPLWRDDLSATLHGLTTATTPVQIAQAHLEAVAFRIAGVRAALRSVAADAEIIGTGAGLLASPIWAQIIADTLGEPIHLSHEEQASARGTALLARERLGLGKVEDASPVTISATVMPRRANFALYQAALERQTRLLKKLWD